MSTTQVKKVHIIKWFGKVDARMDDRQTDGWMDGCRCAKRDPGKLSQ